MLRDQGFVAAAANGGGKRRAKKSRLIPPIGLFERPLAVYTRDG